MAQYELHTLSVLVENKPGVLARVSALVSRRGYNIESLAVAPSDDPRFSRINVVVDGDDGIVEQIVKQLFKLIHVVKISELPPATSTARELLMATVQADAVKRSQVIELVDVFGASIIDVGLDCVSVMLADEPSKLTDFVDLLRPYGVLEIQRTGAVAIPKVDKQQHTKLRAVPQGKAS